MFEEEKIIAKPRTPVSLQDYPTHYTGNLKEKQEAKDIMKGNLNKLKDLQDKLYAYNQFSVLLIFQAMDAGGKDSTIRHVMSGVNPQGCQVFSFKQPSHEELEHDFLWRTYRALPERGRIGIFNRSYYEEVLVTRVHPEYILKQRIPGVQSLDDIQDTFWEERYRSINEMERHLSNNGTVILKFFLHVSKEEQKKRFLKRIHRDDKNWKFTMSDVREREHWDEYQVAFEKAISHTSTEYAPWYIIPADHKWFMRTVVSQIIVERMEALNLHYPRVSARQKEEIEKARVMLEAQD